MEQSEKSPGEQIRFLRKSAGKSQAELAERLGVQQSFLSAVERGVRKMPAAWHLELSQEFGEAFSSIITKPTKSLGVLIERTSSRTNRRSKTQSSTIFASKSAINAGVLNEAERQNNLLNIIRTPEDAEAAATRHHNAEFPTDEHVRQFAAAWDKERSRFSKFIHLLDKQHPNLHQHQQRLEQLSWLIRDAQEAINQNFSPIRPELPTDAIIRQNSKNQDFGQYSEDAIKTLEQSLPLSEVASELIAAIERFIQAVPAANWPFTYPSAT